MESHYIPVFTRENGRKREAVCGEWILPSQHSNEPTHDVCARWLLQEADNTKTADESFGKEETQ